MSPYLYDTFSDEDIDELSAPMKIGLLGTVTPEGLPHVTMLSTLVATSPAQLAFGQFTEGLSKQHLRVNPKAGYLVMSLDKHLWRGKAAFARTARSGKDYDHYNNTPMFRYNAYFGVHTVYYLDLLTFTARETLPMNRIVWAAIQTLAARSLGSRRPPVKALNPWTQGFLNKLDNLKFLAYVDEDGYPVLVPAIQAQCLNNGEVVFTPSVYTEELSRIPTGCSLAVFCLALTMEDVLVRGTYQGIRRVGGFGAGVISVDYVYNPMPPVPGQVYPPAKVQAVTRFQ